MSDRSQEWALEDRLRSVTIGEPEELSGPIELVEYDAGWVNRFDREGEKIGRALGSRALDIQHIGSTAVPGLVAKPIIDILLVVADSADESAYVPPLEEAGFTLRIREPDWYEHRMLRTPDRGVHLHVFTAGSPEIDRMILFRDRLRTSQTDRDAYATAKRNLASRTWKYMQGYADAKAEIVEEILARARAETG